MISPAIDVIGVMNGSTSGGRLSRIPAIRSDTSYLAS